MKAKVCTRKIEFNEKCELKPMRGKCIIFLEKAIFCLDCHAIHINRKCPNCYSMNQVKATDLFFSSCENDELTVREKTQKLLNS